MKYILAITTLAAVLFIWISFTSINEQIRDLKQYQDAISSLERENDQLSKKVDDLESKLANVRDLLNANRDVFINLGFRESF